MYKVVLKTSDIEYKTDGESIDEALGKLGLTWEHIKAKGVITVSKDKTTYEHLFYQRQLRRIFANKLTRLIWAKRLTLLLKETAAMNG